MKLSKLPKPPLYSQVTFYRQNPGSPTDLCQRKIVQGVLDPSHPATQTPYAHFPNTQTEFFTLRAFPTALLSPNPNSSGSPAWPRIDTWNDRVIRAAVRRNSNASEHPKSTISSVVYDQNPQLTDFVDLPRFMPHAKGSIPMPLYFVLSKARTHKHAVKRRVLRTKVREAIDLIVTRGAHVQPASKELAFSSEEVLKRGNKWILPDWAYICFTTSQVYLALYPDLVKETRKALQKIWDAGTRLEVKWASAEYQKLQIRVPPGRNQSPNPQPFPRRNKSPTK